MGTYFRANFAYVSYYLHIIMGGFFAKALEKIMGKDEKRILMVGLDAAGKTTILYKLKLGDVITSIPTIGFNVETVEYKNIEFTLGYWRTAHDPSIMETLLPRNRGSHL